ncbi:SET and MYND domain-containing protein 4 isoform X3 [Pelobates fuscus]|uniref:SET and MYND domain-containing protein 4 isoform X3 n=1 Tax=Pelobates fuscus TaxID=191477 RepID=UPI002FE4C030
MQKGRPQGTGSGLSQFQMEYPVQEWQDYAHKKWLHLPSAVKIQFSASSDLAESFMVCWSQLQQEEEEVLEKLCSDLSVKKEPHAVLFYKLEGNKRFGRKQYTAAAVLYSKAISHASPDNEEMAVCFANRSAVLFHLAHYSECLEDIERAKEHGLPDRLKCKILQRQTECLQRLKESTTPSASSSKTEMADYSPVESQKSSRLATAVFPVLSLLNHSCNPNTSVSFQGRFVTVRASRPIQKGEEVAHCYGPHKSRLPIEERQKLLMAQYFFTCRCEACTEELGSTDKLTDFCCPKCQSPLKGEAELHCLTVTCLQRSRRDQLLLRLQRLEHTVDIAKEQVHRNHIETSIRMLKSCLSEGEKFLSPNHILLGEISDQLAQAEASKGDWRAAAVHLTRSVQHVELRYGSCSLELGHELFKLAQILFNGCEVADAMNTILRAQQILSMNYGTDHNLVRELQEMKACLLQLPGIQDSQRR